ncbi:MAG: DNA mismatch repair endonuclease MutL, partial [Methanoregulaceae archaeon]|nr:DNA mismatch repair endonuclease MutL [Methanoregulaceae archaeon]
MTGNPAIRVLDGETVTGIAAGEVVERWASVAKELVENAIDAGAGRILVEVVSSDRSIASLRVTDDGCGMNPEDASVAFLPHATSKIRVLADLRECRTLGFRGEALASIAAVARVTMMTRTTDGGTGTLVAMRGGVQERLEHTGAPPGTSVQVEMLFYNTPGRRKFQKPAAYELSRISSQIEALALSHPRIAFRLVQNGKERLYTSGSGELSGAIVQLYGPALARELIPVHGKGPGFSISGYVSRPAVSRTHPYQVLVSINGRPVASKEVASAIRAAYGTLLPKDRYPVAFVALEIEPGGIDANVHPA